MYRIMPGIFLIRATLSTLNSLKAAPARGDVSSVTKRASQGTVDKKSMKKSPVT